jgi:tRNA-dihydrouridine synthase
MLGRAIFGNPWLFANKQVDTKAKLTVLAEHTKLFEKYYRNIKNFDIMKKHFKAYVNGFDGAKELRKIGYKGWYNKKYLNKKKSPTRAIFHNNIKSKFSNSGGVRFSLDQPKMMRKGPSMSLPASQLAAQR